MNLNIILLSISLLLSSFLSAQYFEGYIDYQIDIISKKKDNNEKVRMLYGVHGKSMRWYLKNSQYKKVYNNSDVIEEKIYDPTTNTIHEFTVKNQAYQVKDASDDPSYMMPTPAKTERIEIKGYSCSRTDYETREFTIEVYHANKLIMPDGSFNTHKVHQLDAIFKQSSVPLKIVYDYKDVTVIYRALDIKRFVLKEDIFELKEGLSTIRAGVKNELDHRLEYPSDSSFSIDIIGWMHSVNNLDTSAQMQFHNEDKHMNMIVKSLSKNKIDDKAISFDDYVLQSQNDFSAKLIDPSIKEIVSGPINGMFVRNFEMTGDDHQHDHTYYYQIGIIKGRTNYYAIACWTYAEEKGLRVPLMKKMIKSLKEL